MTMTSKSSDVSSSETANSALRLFFGQGHNEAMLNMQKELLEAYEHASRAWLARMKSEAELWSELAAKLTATHSIPEGLAAYQKCVAQRMQMAAEDGRELFDECQKIGQKIGRSLSNGWSTRGM
jgi:hypothetical protein